MLTHVLVVRMEYQENLSKKKKKKRSREKKEIVKRKVTTEIKMLKFAQQFGSFWNSTCKWQKIEYLICVNSDI